MSNTQVTTLNKVVDKVKVNSYMLHSGMNNMIETELSGTNIITKKKRRFT
jgi:hypothetical protein